MRLKIQQELAALQVVTQQLPDATVALVDALKAGYIDPKLAALTAQVGTKANATDVTSLQAAVGGKASAADVTSLQAAVSTKASAADLSTLQTAVGGKATTAALATLQTAVDGKLSKSGDTATGAIMVPKATLDAAAPRLDQTYGGLNAPIRFATAVGATPVALLPGPLSDPTPQGRKAKPYQVVLTMRSAPATGATITVGTTSGGAEVFTKTYTLALLPGLNAVLAPLQPAFLELPAGTTLWAKATAGTWDVEVFSYYKA